MAKSEHRNKQLPVEVAEALQRQLYNAANQALQKAMAADDISPALLSSIQKILSEAGVVPSVAEADSPLWKLSETLESVGFLDNI